MGTSSKILAGYGVDGRAVYAPVTIADGEIICPECEGNGTRTYDNGTDGFSRPFKATCDHCDGVGTLEIETLEEE